MTLCIGAIAEFPHAGDRGPWLVFGSDWRSGSEAAASDGMFKIDQVSPYWPVMFAGDYSAANRLIQHYQQHFVPPVEFSDSAVDQCLAPALTLKERIIDEHLRGHYGVSRADLLSGAGRPKHLRDALTSLEELSLDALLIFGGFVNPDRRRRVLGMPAIPELLMLDGYSYAVPRITRRDRFVCIGTGHDAADAFLHYRNLNPTMSVETVAYLIFEAFHFAAPIADGVSRSVPPAIVAFQAHRSSQGVLHAHQWTLMPHAMAMFQKLFHETFGPKKMPDGGLREIGLEVTDIMLDLSKLKGPPDITQLQREPKVRPDPPPSSET